MTALTGHLFVPVIYCVFLQHPSAQWLTRERQTGKNPFVEDHLTQSIDCTQHSTNNSKNRNSDISDTKIQENSKGKMGIWMIGLQNHVVSNHDTPLTAALMGTQRRVRCTGIISCICRPVQQAS